VGRSIAIAVVAAALCLAAPPAAHAAGLGKLTVLSALGQPLNAEVEIVSLQPGEEDGLAARLGSPEAFKGAGIEFNAVLNGLRLAIERRNNRSYLRLTTIQPVNEPFLDLLVELQWSTGRLVREYTFLLDPPEYKGQSAIAAAPAVPAAPAQTAPAAPVQPPVAPEAPAQAQPAPEVAAQAPAAAEAPQPEAQKSEEQKPEAQKPAEGAPPIEEKPLAPAPETKPAAEAKPAAAPGATYEVKKGDTLGAIARQHLTPGVTLDQMLIAIYRANQSAFIRDNINLVRAGRILNIPEGETAGTLDPDDAKRLVQSHRADFNAYRSRLAAVPAPAEASPGQREVTGKIEPKPSATPQEKQDQLTLSKADPKKPSAPAARAAQEDDLAARERALREAQSRVTDLEKNVTDLQKLLELKNQQLAELEKKANAKPAPVVPVPAPAAKAPEKPAPAPAAKAPEKPAAEAPKPAPGPVAKAPEKPTAETLQPAAPSKPAAEAPKPAVEAPKPAAEAPKPAAEAPKPAAEAPKPKPPAEAPKPAPKKAPPPPPEPSLVDEFADNPVALAALGGVIVLLAGYGVWAWRRKKKSQAKFQDSVLDAASGAGAASVFGAPASGAGAGPGASQASVSQAPAGMEAEEVDPIAEADVYMAYGRDAQAEEILKEALAKDANRITVHSKLLEIYANRKDAKSFEQTALKLKGLTNGAGPDWNKAAALGRSIDPQNGLYGGGGGGGGGAAPSAAAPTLDFDLGGGTQPPGRTPDITLDAAPKGAAPSMDFDLGAAATPSASDQTSDFTPEGTLIMDHKGPESTGGLDFDLGLPTGETKTVPPPPPPHRPQT
jgi:pilus assembly protein FimV